MKSRKRPPVTRFSNDRRSGAVRALLILTIVCLGTLEAAAQAGQTGGFTDADVPLVVATPTPSPEPTAKAKPAADVAVKAGQPLPTRGRMKLTSYTREGSPDAEVGGLVMEIAPRYGVDPELVFCLMRKESSFKRKALSHKGASGLMQLMPATARRFDVSDIFDPRQNITGGVRYLRWLMDAFGEDRLDLVLAGYNAGEGSVIKYGRSVPPYSETRDYVKVITGRYGGLVHRRPAVAQR